MQGSEFRGQARWHNAFREWAAEELGDTRQVYARRADAPEDAPLIYMPDGEAHQFREAAKSGALICPVPECPSKRLTACAYREKRDHFRHVGPRPSHTHRRTYRRLTTYRMLRDWVAGQDRVVDQGRPVIRGVPLELDKVSFILVARLDDDSGVALCYVDKRLGADAWEEHHDALRRLGFTGAWIFALTKTYFALPNQADQVAEGTNLILDKPIYERMRKRGSWPLLLNLEEREWANLLVPGGSRAENLGFSRPDLDHVVHALPNPLADSRLCPYGIETPAINEWILRESSRNKHS